LKKKYFPAPDRVPTELEEVLLHWKTDDAKERQDLLLQSLNVTVPNNPEQQLAFDSIMESINHMVEAGRDKMTSHVCHIITGLGELVNRRYSENCMLHVKQRNY
jgi:hypothetical protein